MALYRHRVWADLIVQVDPETLTLEGIIQEPVPNVRDRVMVAWAERRDDWVEACKHQISVTYLITLEELVKVPPNEYVQAQ